MGSVIDKPTIKKVESLLNDLLIEDPVAFYKMTRDVHYSITGKPYSLFGVLNMIFGNDELQLGYLYDKPTNVPEKVMIVDKETYLKMAEK